MKQRLTEIIFIVCMTFCYIAIANAELSQKDRANLRQLQVINPNQAEVIQSVTHNLGSKTFYSYLGAISLFIISLIFAYSASHPKILNSSLSLSVSSLAF